MPIAVQIPIMRCFVPFAFMNTYDIIITASPSNTPRESDVKTIYAPRASKAAHIIV